MQRKRICFTPFGRRIHIPFINDKIASRRNFAERSAINAPIQGGAADLIKIVMPKIYNYLQNKELKTKMLIQVHDELIFEVPEKEIDLIKEEIPKIMVGSHKTLLTLNVPIKVDIGVGNELGSSSLIFNGFFMELYKYSSKLSCIEDFFVKKT